MEEFDTNDGDDWVATYADAITLLMAFFVLLYSMSTIDAKKYEVLRYSLSKHLGQRSELADYEGVPEDLETDAGAEDSPQPAGGSQVSEEDRALADSMKQTLSVLLAKGGDVRVTEAGIMMELPGDHLYKSGSAELRDEARKTLGKIARSVNVGSTAGMLVTVEGHTDDQPISTGKFSSNWDLAAVRASRVADLFASGGLQRERVRSISYGDTRPRGSNATAAGRARNRRVTVLFQHPEKAGWGASDDLNWGLGGR